MTAVFISIINMSITASAVIAAVLIARLILRLLNAPRKYSYFLWLAAAFRLCCPLSPRSVLSIFGGLRRISRLPAVSEGVMREYISIPSPPYSPSAAPPLSAQAPAAPLSSGPAAAAISPADAAMLVWCLGMAVMLIYCVAACIRLRRDLLGAEKVGSNVYASVNVSTPFVFGLFRPKIYIPAGLAGETRQLALRHEAYHLKRLDHIAKPFAYLLLTVHWFNPLCWLAFFLMSRDMEMSCDEKILSELGGPHKEYAYALLSMGGDKRFPKPGPLNFGASDVKKRIKNILRWSRPKTVITVIAPIICLAVLAACATDPARVEPDPPEVSPGADETFSPDEDGAAPPSEHGESAESSPDGDAASSFPDAYSPGDREASAGAAEQQSASETRPADLQSENDLPETDVTPSPDNASLSEVREAQAENASPVTVGPAMSPEPVEPSGTDETEELRESVSPEAYTVAEPFSVYGSFGSYEQAAADIESDHPIDGGGISPGWSISETWDGPGAHLIVAYLYGAPHTTCGVFIATDNGDVYRMPIRVYTGEFTVAAPTNGIAFSPDGSSVSWSLVFDSSDGRNADPPKIYHYAGTYTFTADIAEQTFLTVFRPAE